MPATIISDPVAHDERRDQVTETIVIRDGVLSVRSAADERCTATIALIEWSGRIVAMADALSVPDGGFSVDPTDGSDVRVGYAVAVHPEHERILNRVTVNDLHDYIASASDALSLSGRVLGGWRDPASGRIYLDVSVVTTDLAEAMALARATAQLAIFDLSAMQSITVTSPAPTGVWTP